MDNLKFNPIEEKTINDKLVNLYSSHIPGLYKALKPLFDDPASDKPALPLLIELYEDDNGEYPYEKADLRVMVFGRETNNWNDEEYRKGAPYTDLKYNFELQNSDDIIAEISGIPDEIHGIGDIYGDYCYHDTSVRKTQFTQRKDQLLTQIRDRLPNLRIEEVWNNLFKMGMSKSDHAGSACKVSNAIQMIEHVYFNVIPLELEILKPDIVIFLTGKDPIGDKEIEFKFGLNNTAFTPVKDGLFLHRINIPGVKYAARTIHPSRQSKENLKLHFDALVDDIIRVMQ